MLQLIVDIDESKIVAPEFWDDEAQMTSARQEIAKAIDRLLHGMPWSEAITVTPAP